MALQNPNGRKEVDPEPSENAQKHPSVAKKTTL
jgi:hypothetical protein